MSRIQNYKVYREGKKVRDQTGFRLSRQRIQKHKDLRHKSGLWVSDSWKLQEAVGRLNGQGSIPLFLIYTLCIGAI